jgi:hypothetical protein
VVSACVWDYNEGMQMLRFFWDEAVAQDPAIEPKDERHMKLSREGQLGELWKRAGLIKVQEKPLTIDQAYASFEDYWGSFLKGAGPGGAYVVSLSEERRRELDARMRKRLIGNREDGPFASRPEPGACGGKFPTPADVNAKKTEISENCCSVDIQRIKSADPGTVKDCQHS